MLSILLLPLLLFAATFVDAQQTYQEQSTIDLFGNRNPIFNYMPNPGHVDVDRLDWYQQNVDLREEEGWWHLFPYGPLYSDASLLIKPNHDRQIDFDFDFPFYGFRFNYTMIYPDGLLAFSNPEFIQPPFTFPNPRWPEQRDASFIAPFYAEQTFQYIGERGISNVWYRLVFRPRAYEMMDEWGNPLMNPLDNFGDMFRTSRDRYDKRRWGRVEDPYLLDNITMTIREGIIGANGFRADYAVIVTWERMAYGGAPKITQVNRFEEAKRWTNTYQVVLATDEIRSYVIFNYAHINWTSSNVAGALQGRGGLQSAVAGFNAGNGTGWTPLPYSGEGRVLKLQEFSNVGVPGRWLYRVDEEIINGGCSNNSIGYMTTAPIAASMIGGVLVNVSGPCLRAGDVVKVIFDEYQVDCVQLNMHRAQCILPVNTMFRTGLVNTKFSRDGGQSYPYVGVFYVLQPSLAMPQVKLIDNPREDWNVWRSHNATRLRLEWAPYNLTNDINSMVDIKLMGYWEDTDDHVFEEVGTIALRTSNYGVYEFDPRTLARTSMVYDSWRRYSFGVVRVSLSDQLDQSAGVFWSKLTPFGWYFRDVWEYEYGPDWALELCQDWFDYDGKRVNYAMDLEPVIPCPCVLDQAVLDMGRFMPLYGCDKDGDASCIYHKGAQHCVMSNAATWTGASQVCCYDFEGWLMHSDDYENSAHLRFFSPGTSLRSHPMGYYPFKRPPYVPSLSHFHTDVMAYEKCCKWAGNCEFYFWRRRTSDCIDYIPPVAGIAYGDPHFITFDGTRYSFQGKGYYMLTMAKDPRHDFQVQVRMEQPPITDWNSIVQATVITGVAARENQSDVVQLFARKEFRNWRYRMDIIVNGHPCYFDTPELKYQRFRGVTLRSPERNHNQSEIQVMFDSGAGMLVSESHGVLAVMTLLPPEYNETYAFYRGADYFGTGYDEQYRSTGNARPEYVDKIPPPSTIQYSAGVQRFVTVGLLGTFNDNHLDDLMFADGHLEQVAHPPSENDNRISYRFGQSWRIDGSRHKLLFQDNMKPIYNPLLFADERSYFPVFDPYLMQFNMSLAITLEEVRVACQNVYECEYDYFLTGRREIAMGTLEVQTKLAEVKHRGSVRMMSCGALLTAPGVIKYPPGNNYLDGVRVTLTCKPEFFAHGDQQRTCINGTWTPGWHVWCRRRTMETALKWMTGILSSTAILLFIFAIYGACYMRRLAIHPETRITFRPSESGDSRRSKTEREASPSLSTVSKRREGVIISPPLQQGMETADFSGSQMRPGAPEIILHPAQLAASPQPLVSILRRSVARTVASTSSYTNMGAEFESAADFWGRETRA